MAGSNSSGQPSSKTTGTSKRPWLKLMNRGTCNFTVSGETPTPSPMATSTPAFGSSTTPPFGVSSTTVIGESKRSRKSIPSKATPGFESPNPAHSNPFGSTFGQTQTASGSQPFGSATSQPAFGSTSTSSSFSQLANAFGTACTPAFRNSPQFTTPGFESANPAHSNPFGNTFGRTQTASGSQPFGSATSQPAFGSTSTSSSFSQSANAFGTACTPAFRNSPSQFATPGFESPNPAHSNPFGSNFGQTHTTSGSQPFGSATSQPSFGSTSTSSSFSQSVNHFGTASTPAFGNGPSQFEGGPISASQQPAGSLFSQPAKSCPFGQTTPSVIGQTTSSAFGPAFGPASAGNKATGFGSLSGAAFNSHFGATSSSSPFGTVSSSSPAFGGASSASPFGQSIPTFGQSAPASSASPFGQTTPFFRHSTPAFGQTSNAFGQTTHAFGSNLFSSSTASVMSQSKLSGVAQSMTSLFGGFQNSAPTQAQCGAFSFGNFGQQQATASGFGTASAPAFCYSGQQNMMVMTPQPVSNPFGTLPPVPQMFIGCTVPSIQYGISSLPVNEKPLRVRMTTQLLTPRLLAPRARIQMHSRRYNPKIHGPRVSFFSDGDEASNKPKADAVLFIPRENPRALFIRKPEQSSSMALKPGVNLKEMAIPINDNDTKENWPGGVEDANIQKKNSLLSSKTGHHCTEGAELETFKKRLKIKSEKQGAEFVSFSAIKREWKFRVKHFCRYGINKSGFCEMWRNMREFAMAYLKSKVWI